MSQRHFQVLDPIALDPVALKGQAPSFILDIRSNEFGGLESHRYNHVGSILVKAYLRLQGDRYFCDQVRSWTYPDEENWYGMSESTSITTVTFQPDGTGTLSLRDKLDPANDMHLKARDIPVHEHWSDRFAFGQWDIRLNLPMFTATKTPLF